MAKEFKDWIDEFVENGANPKNVVKWPDEVGGTKVVTELPQVGEEHIIYELQEKKIIPSLIPRITQQMIDDGLVIEIALSTFVFNTYDEMVNTITPLIPNNESPNRFNYIIKEDKLIMSIYGGTDWQFIEATKVSDYKFDLTNALGSEEHAYVVMFKEYLGKTYEGSGNVRYTGKLLNDELYTFETNTFTFCIVLGATTSGMMNNNACMEGAEIPEDTPKELIFEYIPYEKIIKESTMQWVFKPKGTGEVTVSSYWIYTNEAWFNADEIRKFKSQEKTVSPSTYTLQITPDKGYDGLSKVTVNAIQLQNKTVSPTTSTQLVIRDADYSGLGTVTVNAVTSAIDSTIKAENIKKGVFILGVTGTYDGVTYNIETLPGVLQGVLYSMGVAQVGSNVYLFGGDGVGRSRNDILKFNVETETISTLTTTLPQALQSMGVAQVGSDVYLFGGNKNGNTKNTIYKFNTETETISTLSVTLPGALQSMGVAQVGSNVYLFGGYTNGNATNTIYKFNTETETISTLSVTLPGVLYGMGVAQVGRYAYLFGGSSSSSSQRVNTIYKFNTETETTSTLSVTLPQALQSMGVAQVGSNVYLFGGNSGRGLTNKILKFNTETETISTLSVTLPKALQSMGVAQVGSDVYLFGGDGDGEIRKFNIQF